MAYTSVITVDVQDEKFKAYQELFTKQQEALKKLPGDWAKVGAAVEDAHKAIFDDAPGKKLEESRKSALDRMKALLGVSGDTNRIMAQTESHTKAIAKNLANGTKSLLKWSGIASVMTGLLGGGSLFGMARLATGASGDLRSSRGLGVTSGEQQAMAVNYSRYFDTNSVLSNIAEAKSNWNDRWAFSAMGVQNQQQKDPAQLATEMAIRAKQIFDHSDQSQQAAQSRGLLQFYSMEDLRRLHAASMKDLEQSQQQYGVDRRTLEVDPKVQQAWQKLDTQLDLSGQKIRNTFILGLAPLAPNLAKLSDSFSDAVAAFLKNPQLSKWIDDFSDELGKAAKYLRSPDFKAGFDHFLAGVNSLGRAIGKAVDFIDGLLGGETPAPGTAPSLNGAYPPSTSTGDPVLDRMNAARKGIGDAAYSVWDAGRVHWSSPRTSYDTAEDRRVIEGFPTLDKKYGLPGGTVDRVFTTESARGKNNTNADSGAIGPFQFIPETAKDRGVDPWDMKSASEGAANYLSDLRKQFGGDDMKAVAAYNWGPGKLKKEIEKYGEAWQSHLPASVERYIENVLPAAAPQGPAAAPGTSRMIVQIHNNTGGSAIISTNQAAY